MNAAPAIAPISAMSQSPTAPEQRPAGGVQRATVTGRILVVDDDPHIRQFVRGVLEDEGFLVDTAENGRSAIARARANRPDVVVLDMMLPDIPGEGVAQLLRAQVESTVRILVITADTRAAEKAHASGAYAFLRKPFDLDDLVRLVHDGLAA